MKTIISGDYYGSEKVTKFQSRVSTATEMYNLQNKLQAEQETGGVYSAFVDELMEWAAEKNISVSLITDMFVGRNEVIFELDVYLRKHIMDEEEILSTEVLGHVIQKIKSHFEWEWLCADPHLNNKVKELIK